MYINLIFRPFEPHLHHFAFREWERSLGVRAQLICVRKKWSNINFGKFFIPKPTFQSLQHFLSRPKAHFFKLENFSFIELSMRPTNQPLISFAFFIQNSWKWFYFWLKDVSSWFNMQNSTCTFMFQIEIFDQNFSSAHEIHYLACITSVSVSTSNHPRFSKNLVIMSKTYQNSHFRFYIVSNTFHFQVIILWLFKFPNH